jgi:hypothetical protein
LTVRIRYLRPRSIVENSSRDFLETL